ncbi:DUF805 domain-containing protein [Porticoccaceae bacterium LTM1]|nr:DUF805 domain-containing protein [Porticoccaceae bacterium LTM1]
MNYYLAVIKKYAVFSGRARRSEYWFFVLFNLIISFAMGFIDGLTGMFNSEVGLGVLGGFYSLFILIPSIAVSVRRMHDTGRSGWWVLINLVPLVGWIIFLVFSVQDSNDGSNEYGDSPKVQMA